MKNKALVSPAPDTSQTQTKSLPSSSADTAADGAQQQGGQVPAHPPTHTHPHTPSAASLWTPGGNSSVNPAVLSPVAAFPGLRILVR